MEPSIQSRIYVGPGPEYEFDSNTGFFIDWKHRHDLDFGLFGYFYVFRWPDGSLKLGHSGNLRKREMVFNRHIPVANAELLLYVKCETTKLACALERHLQYRLARFQVDGEFYRFRCKGPSRARFLRYVWALLRRELKSELKQPENGWWKTSPWTDKVAQAALDPCFWHLVGELPCPPPVVAYEWAWKYSPTAIARRVAARLQSGRAAQTRDSWAKAKESGRYDQWVANLRAGILRPETRAKKSAAAKRNMQNPAFRQMTIGRLLQANKNPAKIARTIARNRQRRYGTNNHPSQGTLF